MIFSYFLMRTDVEYIKNHDVCIEGEPYYGLFSNKFVVLSIAPDSGQEKKVLFRFRVGKPRRNLNAAFLITSNQKSLLAV